MTIRESVKHDIDTLPDEALAAVKNFVLFQKNRELLVTDDATYLNSISGMTESIKEGIETPLSECVPLSKVWLDV
jgi:hypothetical protein